MKIQTQRYFWLCSQPSKRWHPPPAKDKPAYEHGVLLQMDSTHCGYAEKDGKTVAGEIFGTDGSIRNTKSLMPGIYLSLTADLSHPAKDEKHRPSAVGESRSFVSTRTRCSWACRNPTARSASTSSFR